MAERNPQLTLENILLGLIRQEPLHGYGLYQKLQETPELSLIWHVKRSKLYYLLEKLESKGLINGTVRSQESYPDRISYQLTAFGEDLYQQWISTPVQSGRHIRVEFLPRLHFALSHSRSDAENLIQAQIDVCRTWISSLESQLEELKKPDYISRQVFLFRIGQIQAMVTWLKDCRLELPE